MKQAGSDRQRYGSWRKNVFRCPPAKEVTRRVSYQAYIIPLDSHRSSIGESQHLCIRLDHCGTLVSCSPFACSFAASTIPRLSRRHMPEDFGLGCSKNEETASPKVFIPGMNDALSVCIITKSLHKLQAMAMAMKCRLI